MCVCMCVVDVERDKDKVRGMSVIDGRCDYRMVCRS